MFLTTSLPLVPPPAASLLAPLTNASSEASVLNQASASHQHASRRQKAHAAAFQRINTLAILSADERTIAQRKMAIAMYGYSWLRPAGCAKTMLGRREEDLEREEVERQLREVELQERLQQEADEQDRLAQLGETGEPEGERDLDEDIPDAEGEEDNEDLSDEFDDGDGMEGDLDDEIPDADEDDEEDDDDEAMSPDQETTNADWVYDTRREPDTDEEETGSSPVRAAHGRMHASANVAGVYIATPGSEGYDNYDERDATDLADAMLDEDEIFDDRNAADSGERDLDEDIPEAESEQAWEHTDTELEESEMDISLLPPGAQMQMQMQNQPSRQSISGRQGQNATTRPSRISGRRSSGPWITGPPAAQSPPSGTEMPDLTRQSHNYSRPTPASVHTEAETRARVSSATRARAHAYAHMQHQYIQTPAMLDSPLEVDAELDQQLDDPFGSTGGVRPTRSSSRRDTTRNLAGAGSESTTSARSHRTGAVGAPNGNENPSRATAARNWLDGAAAAVGGSARRTLFGRAARRGNPASSTAGIETAGTTTTTTTAASAVSSGGLFTPSPAIAPSELTGQDWETPVNHNAGQEATGQDHGQPQRETRSRSGRFLTGRSRRDR